MPPSLEAEALPLDSDFLHQPIIESHIRLLEKVASTLDHEEVLKHIVEAAVQFSGADEGVLLLLDEKTGELYIRATKGFGEEPAGTFRQPVSNDTVAGRVVLTGRPVLLGPKTQMGDLKVKTGYLPQSVLNLPIKRGEVIYGVLGVYIGGRQKTFTKRHLELLMPLAKYAAIAIQNARRFRNINQTLGNVYTLFEIVTLLSETRELDELLPLIGSVTLGRAEGADRVVVHLFNPQTNRLERKTRIPPLDNEKPEGRGFSAAEGIAGEVLCRNRCINVPDVTASPTFIARGDIKSGSLLVAPISKRSICLGTISVASPHKNAFGPQDESFLSSLANLSAIAIENARLYDQRLRAYQESQERLEVVERRNKELNSLRDVLVALQSTLSLPEVLKHIGEGVINGLNYQAVMLSTVDEARDMLVVQEFSLESTLMLQGLLEKAEGMTGQKIVGNQASLTRHRENLGIQVCLEKQMRITHDLHDIFRPIVGREMCGIIQKIFQLSTFAVLPIRSNERLFGVLYAGTKRSEISHNDLQALEAFANQAAVAVKNARQFEDVHAGLRRRVQELQSLQGIDRLISSTPEQEKMLKGILDVGLELVCAESGNIVLVEEETGRLIPKVSYPEETLPAQSYEPGLTAWVAEERKTARVQDLSQPPWTEIPRRVNLKSELAAPILVGQELVGVINMGSSQVNAFTEEDESLLNILATQAAVAIQTTRYYQELEKSRQRSFEAERIAAMGDMASNMVHNINNSIGAIRVLVQQIRLKMTSEASPPPKFLARKLASIETSAERTLEMARNIRNPFQTLATELIDVNDCVKSVVHSCSIPSTVAFTLDLEKDLPPVMVTRQLEEIFRNLINNALEAMGGMGTLQIASYRTDPHIEVTVADSGPGLKEDLNETSIFNLGVSSKTDGLGYGLWWCKIYLNRVGGNIRLDPDITTGCKFVVRLPLEYDTLSM